VIKGELLRKICGYLCKSKMTMKNYTMMNLMM